MLRTEMPWYAKLGTTILATAIGGGCIIATLLALPIGLIWDLGSWLRRCGALSPAGGAVASGGINPARGIAGGIAGVGGRMVHCRYPDLLLAPPGHAQGAAHHRRPYGCTTQVLTSVLASMKSAKITRHPQRPL
jgi:hypothetical protein